MIDYEHPHRTLTMRLYNACSGWWEGRFGRRPLTVERLQKLAEKSARLDDWGADLGFLEPLQVLVQAVEAEEQITPIGRLVIEKELVGQLATRLRLQHYQTQFPEIRDLPVRRPIFVVGLPRTGTTLLYNLLCQDPRCQPLMIWDAMHPAPAPSHLGGKRDHRQRDAKLVCKLINGAIPDLKYVHPMEPDSPEECWFLLAPTFVNLMFCLKAPLPQYREWLQERDTAYFEGCYQYYRQLLQMIQWGRDSEHWVLKSPINLGCLDSLLNVFPDGCLIHTHRNLSEVLPSWCSLMALVRGAYSDRVDCQEIGAETLQSMKEILERAVAKRANYQEQILDVQFRKLVENPIDCVEAIYRHFDLDMPATMLDRMEQWLAENPRHKHGAHRYSLDQFGLTADMIDEACGDYQKQFGELSCS